MPELNDEQDDLAAIAARARDGDHTALGELVRRLQDDIYHLALRFRWDPEDAADATQEVLTRIVTRLGTWRGEASVRTWAWRIAANHLRDRAPTPFERSQLSLDAFAADLADGLEPPSPALEADQNLLAEEVKLGCTLGMLQCLDRDQRLAFILGDVFELSSDEAAAVSGTSPATHRKRLSRARSRLRHFVAGHCGLVNDRAPCRCTLRINRATELGRLDPAAPRFASSPGSEGSAGSRHRSTAVEDGVLAMERLHDLASLMRSHPEYRLPARAWIDIERLLGATEQKASRDV